MLREAPSFFSHFFPTILARISLALRCLMPKSSVACIVVIKPFSITNLQINSSCSLSGSFPAVFRQFYCRQHYIEINQCHQPALDKYLSEDPTPHRWTPVPANRQLLLELHIPGFTGENFYNSHGYLLFSRISLSKSLFLLCKPATLDYPCTLYTQSYILSMFYWFISWNKLSFLSCTISRTRRHRFLDGHLGTAHRPPAESTK